MRWFLGLLVLVNVAILLWGSLSGEQKPDDGLAMPGVGSIRLVEQPAPAEAPTAVPIPAPPRSDGVLNKPLETEESQQQAALPAMPVAEEDVEIKPQAQPDAEAGRQPPEPLVSAAEALVAQSEEVPEQKAVGPDSARQLASPRYCSRIGPFDDSAAAQGVRAYLVDRGGKVEVSEETNNIRVGFWVMVPPQRDRVSARVLSEKLKAKGIKDFWIIPKGEYQHAVSLGVFSQQANASAFAKRVAEKGFAVNTVEKFKERTAVWLRYQGATFIPPMEIRSRAPDGVQAEHQDCP